MTPPKKVGLSNLKAQFGAWQVPSEEHFDQLINVASLSWQPGAGLAGGDPSTTADCVDIAAVTPLCVLAGNGIDVSSNAGITLHLCQDGGLALPAGRLTAVADLRRGVAPESPSGLAIRPGAAVQVGQAVSLCVETKAGLTCAPDNRLGVHVDGRTLEIADGELKIKCREAGGLTINAQGELALDIEWFCEQVFIRVHQGKAKIFLPDSQVGSADKHMFYINDTYCGEIDRSAQGHYVGKVTHVGGYYIINLEEWVATGDDIGVRSSPSETLRVSHKVTALESTPHSHLPRIVEGHIDGVTNGRAAAGTVLRLEYQAKLHAGMTDASVVLWEWYDKTELCWKTAAQARQFTPPASYVGYRMRVWVTPWERTDEHAQGERGVEWRGPEFTVLEQKS
ncbi:hypothetical protein OM409_16605 [Serratia bockelmannii]|uniref:hypothetical protein n=1 Tax=Serratia TaxID=613 RepID=UPI0019D0DCE2|nr:MULTISPECIES: hypothetical protein [Serratia]BEN03319.1 hypothetical protein SMETH2_34500 [Serratia marcescens]MBN5226131.1 hypothetical protein [Serratia ureilytica]MCW7649138.1 hypothetical protein [Serratia bockelmannii]MCW7659227.1 hypothetical protein [Serratia bockelmannii]MCW7679011.1 hypothetical protein [Serratia bockelmannii]